MNEELLRIQKMVAEGKITPEESLELLASVKSGPPVPSGPKEKLGILTIILLAAAMLMALALIIPLILFTGVHQTPPTPQLSCPSSTSATSAQGAGHM